MVKAGFKRLKYKNIAILILGIIFAVVLSKNDSFRNFLLNLGQFGYFGAFVAGIFFASTFTVASSLVILATLAETLPIWVVAVLGGIGCMVGDFFIFYFVKNELLNEIRSIYEFAGGGHFKKILHSRFFSWTLPVIGAIIIASPLPDELGVTLLGLSRLKTYKFLIISFLLNTAGIFLFLSGILIFKN